MAANKSHSEQTVITIAVLAVLILLAGLIWLLWPVVPKPKPPVTTSSTQSIKTTIYNNALIASYSDGQLKFTDKDGGTHTLALDDAVVITKATNPPTAATTADLMQGIYAHILVYSDTQKIERITLLP